jgi:hypothetical protein
MASVTPHSGKILFRWPENCLLFHNSTGSSLLQQKPGTGPCQLFKPVRILSSKHNSTDQQTVNLKGSSPLPQKLSLIQFMPDPWEKDKSPGTWITSATTSEHSQLFAVLPLPLLQVDAAFWGPQFVQLSLFVLQFAANCGMSRWSLRVTWEGLS